MGNGNYENKKQKGFKSDIHPMIHPLYIKQVVYPILGEINWMRSVAFRCGWGSARRWHLRRYMGLELEQVLGSTLNNRVAMEIDANWNKTSTKNN